MSESEKPRPDSDSDLIVSLNETIRHVQTKSLDISFNEIVDMINSGEMRISPDFQRLFQWSEGSRSRFVESLLLEMPIPPIYVVEDKEGEYTLIDGLQRISSYLHFRGQLEAAHLQPPVKKGEELVLSDCDIVPALNGKSFKSLPSSLQIRAKRAFVRVEVVRRGSDPRFRYYMFKRLNTGGEPLEPQQIRNCTIRLLGSTFIDYIKELARNADFRLCVAGISDAQWNTEYDKELILRFFAFKNHIDDYEHDIADFLTEYLEGVSDTERRIPFDYGAEKAHFEDLFLVLSKALGERVFGQTKVRGNVKTISTAFTVLQYEAISLGVSRSLMLDRGRWLAHTEELRNRLETIKKEDEFVGLTTGGGKNSLGQLRRRIEYVEQRLRST